MICYLDTSALVKIYIDEVGTDTVQRIIKSSDILATSVVAYAESAAAFKRGLNEKIINKKDHKLCLSYLVDDWPNYLIINADNDLVFLAGDLAEKYNIRGFDSIHLASAVSLRGKIGKDIIFLCWDKKLLIAAEKEGFTTQKKL